MNKFSQIEIKLIITAYIAVDLQYTKYFLQSNQNKIIGCQLGNYLKGIEISRKK